MGYTCTCNYGFEQNIFSYVHGTTSDGVVHTTARGVQNCVQNVQANSCDYSAHASERKLHRLYPSPSSGIKHLTKVEDV